VRRHLTKRRWLLGLLGLAAVLGIFLFGKWRDASNRGGQQPAEPFRIAGNLYYVGANDVTSFLITGPDGHVLIDGGYPGTAPMIMASIAKLGFDIQDVKVLLNSHAHFDHAGGLAALQEASGAELWISEGDADIVAAGGAGDPTLGPFRFVSYLPVLRYPAPRVDHRFTDGATIRVGPVELTAHVTAGHTPGCTSWSFPVRDGDRELLVVHICSLTPPPALSLGEYPEIRADFERSFRTLRSLPADIFLTSHGREFGRYRKFVERAKARNPADPFIDPEGYLRSIDSAEVRFRRLVADKQPRP
jgi:metallo-beta-lactamase class B